MSTLAQAALRYALLKSADAAATAPLGDTLMAEHEDRSNMLRLRVLDGEDLTAEEMLYECNKIRQGRRSAAPATRAAKPKARPAFKEPVPPESLLDLLDQAIP